MFILMELERRLRLKLVTSEFEIISWLFVNGSTSSRDLSRCTKASIANFQLIVRRLKEEGILIAQAGSGDRRVREYDLSDAVRTEINRALAEVGLDDDLGPIFARLGLLSGSQRASA